MTTRINPGMVAPSTVRPRQAPRHHKLLPKAIEKQLPPLYSQDGKDKSDVMVPLKIFNPYGLGTWYLYEYDPVERRFFGLVDLFEPEYGYVSLDELEAVSVPCGGHNLPLERDCHWTPKPLSEIWETVQRGAIAV